MNKYQRSERDRDQLGKGGNCIAVERWCLTETRELVAAKLVDVPRCARRETKALQLAKAAKVPRVVQLIDEVEDESNSGTWLVLEYLDGISLSDYTKWRAKQNFYDAAETRMVAAATALIQTLCELHQTAKVAHLDLSLANIMLVPDASNAWEKLRLLDFGLAEPFQPSGPCSNSVQVPGSTLPWASPEVLHSMSARLSGSEHIKYIDGAAADVWAAGSLLYSVLTGVLPFPTSRHVHGKGRRLAAQRAQQSWIAAVRRAQENGVLVSHTLLDNVRACSSTPDAAVAFFCAVLEPSPTARLTSAQALNHPYLRCAVHQMQASYQPSTTPAAATTSKSETRPQGNDILGRLASMPSYGFNMMKSLVSQAMPGNSNSRSRSHKARMRDMARYFPDYVHPSSDAEMSAFQPHAPNDAAQPPKQTPTDVRQLMAGMHQLRADFNLGSAPAAPAAPVSPVAAAPPGLHPIMHAKASLNTDSAATGLHAKAPLNTDSAAAALHLQRQLYPASPLSAGSGFIPALHSAHVQPFRACEGGSDAASDQQHEGTPAQVADDSVHDPPNTYVDEPQPGSTLASCSNLHIVEGQDASAADCATAGSGSREGGSDAASGQQHEGTPVPVAVKSMHIPPYAEMDAPQPDSTQASCSILHTVEEQDTSAEDSVTAGSGSCKRGSAAASGQQHAGTPAPIAVESVYNSSDTSMHEPQLSSAPASHSILHTLEGRDASAKDCATAGSGSYGGGSDAASGQQHEETPAPIAVESMYNSPDTSMHEPQLSSAPASHSILHTLEGRDAFAKDCATAGSADSAAQPPAAVSATSQEQEEGPQSEQTAVLPGRIVQDVVEQRHPEMHQTPITEPDVEQGSCLLTADAAGVSGDSAATVSDSKLDAVVSQEEAFVNHATPEDQLRSHPIDIDAEDEEVMAGAQPSQSLQSPSCDSPGQANGQLPKQRIGALNTVEGTAARASDEWLKSHPLYFCPGFDDDLDVLDPSANVQLSKQHIGTLKDADGTATRASEEWLQSHALYFCPGVDDDLDVLDPSANAQLSKQHVGALKNADGTAARGSEEWLKSHALCFCPGYDNDLDVVDPSDVADAVSNHECPGRHDAHSDPDPYPYLDESAPLQQAHPPQVPLHRIGNMGSRTCETQPQRRGGAMRRFGKALIPLAGALALAALRLASPSSRS